MRPIQFRAVEFTGGVVAALGAAVGLAWLLDAPWIAGAIPAAAEMGIVGPLLLVATGVALVAAARTPLGAARRGVIALSALVLVALGAGYLFETLTGLSLGIDIARAGTAATDANPHPGRISPNASLAFLAVGIALSLQLRPAARARRRAISVCCLVAAAIGTAGLAGHFLGLELLYQFANYNRMLPGTAFGLSLAAAGLWMLRQEESFHRQSAAHSSAKSIQWRSLAVIMLVALGAGVAGFGAMRESFERSVSRGLLLTTSTNARALANSIDLSLQYTRTVASRPPILKALAKLGASPDDPEALAWLRAAAPTLLPLGSGGLRFYDAQGRLLAQAGQFDPGVAPAHVDLRTTAPRASLSWHDGYVIAAEADAVSEGRTVGRIATEQPLKFFDSILGELRSAGDATDAVILGRRGGRAVSSASGTSPTGASPWTDAPAVSGRAAQQALAGQRGVDASRDARGVAMLSAYAPIGDYGVALAVETEVGALYGPVRDRLQVLVAALCAIVGLGFYAQRNQVRPLIKQLVASQGRLQSILEDQSELVSLATPDGRLVYVNPAYARHFGRRAEEMPGDNLFDYIEPAHRAEVRAQFARVLQTGTTMHGENRMVCADGAERWVSWSNTLQRDERGELAIHSVGRDITERKQAETALVASQAFLARTGRVAGIGGWELDLVSGRLHWSEATRRIHDVPDDFEPTLETAIGFYAADDRPIIEAAVQRSIRDGTPWDLELPLTTATGRRIWARAQGEVEIENGVARRLVGAFQDITERRELQEHLAESERFLRKITDSLPVRIAYFDQEGRFDFVNEAYCKRFGRPREQILGRRRDELSAQSFDVIASHLSAALAGEAQLFEFDEYVGGQSVRIESWLVPDIAPDGNVRGAFAIGVDITERSRTERELRALAVIFDNTPDFVVQTDFRGLITYLNPAVRRALELAPDESLEGRHFSDFNTAETNARYVSEILPAVKATGVWLGETTVRVKKTALPVSYMVIAHRDEQGRVARYSAIMRDISASIAAKEQESRQTATLHSITEAIPAIVAVVGANGRYRFVNAAFERWYGATRERIVGRSLMEVLGLKEYERSRPWIERSLTGESVAFEKQYADGAGERHLAINYIPLRLDNGAIDGFVGVAHDITGQRQEEARLLMLSQRDALTGLLNRAGFQQFLEAHEGKAASAEDGQLALLYIDLDHFKPVNDSHGHAVGDQLLHLFAKRLQRIVRPTDAVARLGGDEFAIALVGVREPANAHMVAEKVLAAAAEPFAVGSLTLLIGTSVGVAVGATASGGWRELVERADARLYEAKSAGRGRFSATRQTSTGVDS